MTLEQALEAFNAEFPGWWWTVGECHISCDASMAPDRKGPDADLLNHRFFDDGFHVDLLQPSTVADALFAAMELARKARADYRDGAPLPDAAPPLAPRLSVLCDAWLCSSDESKVEFMNWILDRHEQAAE
jgi:hypothetical protein